MLQSLEQKLDNPYPELFDFQLIVTSRHNVGYIVECCKAFHSQLGFILLYRNIDWLVKIIGNIRAFSFDDNLQTVIHRATLSNCHWHGAEGLSLLCKVVNFLSNVDGATICKHLQCPIIEPYNVDT